MRYVRFELIRGGRRKKAIVVRILVFEKRNPCRISLTPPDHQVALSSKNNFQHDYHFFHVLKPPWKMHCFVKAIRILTFALAVFPTQIMYSAHCYTLLETRVPFVENASAGVGGWGVISKELGTTDLSVVTVLDAFFCIAFFSPITQTCITSEIALVSPRANHPLIRDWTA